MNPFIERLLNLVDESNFHAAGGTWHYLSQIDTGTYVGTLAHWVVFVAVSFDRCVVFNDQRYDEVENIAEQYGPEWLGISRQLWDELEGLPLGRVVEELEAHDLCGW